MSKIVIEGIEYVEAPCIITSNEIELQFKNNIENFGFPENFIENITGVKERRFWESGTTVVQAASLSAISLIDKCGIDKNEIGCIINSSVSRDYVEPTVSCMVHDILKLSDRCINFDVNSACLGFSNAVDIITNMLNNNIIKYGLIINGESSRKVVNLTINRLTNPNISIDDFMLELAALTLGSGSVTMLLCREEDSKGYGHIIEETMFSVDSKHGMLCYGDHTQMVCHSHAMLKAGTFLVNKTWDLCTKEFNIWNDKIDRYVPHQVSNTHSKVLSKYTNIGLDKMELIFPLYGNTGPIAWPMGLVIGEKEGRITKGMNVGILSMGSGFNCCCMRIKW